MQNSIRKIRNRWFRFRQYRQKNTKTIILNYTGGPVGIETLSSTIGEEVETIEDVYEPYLMQMGFIARTPRGRIATPNAYKHLGIEMVN